jgi:hypothetical protein
MDGLSTELANTGKRLRLVSKKTTERVDGLMQLLEAARTALGAAGTMCCCGGLCIPRREVAASFLPSLSQSQPPQPFVGCLPCDCARHIYVFNYVRARLADGAAPVDVLAGLKQAVRETDAVEKTRSDVKGLHAAVSKLGKELDKVCNTESAQLCTWFEGEADVARGVNTAIADHLVRHGRFEAAALLQEVRG